MHLHNTEEQKWKERTLYLRKMPETYHIQDQLNKHSYMESMDTTKQKENKTSDTREYCNQDHN